MTFKTKIYLPAPFYWMMPRISVVLGLGGLFLPTYMGTIASLFLVFYGIVILMSRRA